LYLIGLSNAWAFASGEGCNKWLMKGFY
jgi:hypothetical protein